MYILYELWCQVTLYWLIDFKCYMSVSAETTRNMFFFSQIRKYMMFNSGLSIEYNPDLCSKDMEIFLFLKCIHFLRKWTGHRTLEFTGSLFNLFRLKLMQFNFALHNRPKISFAPKLPALAILGQVISQGRTNLTLTLYANMTMPD